MFVINEDKSIYLTRGDVAFFSISAKTEADEAYKFQPGDVVRFKVVEKKACDNVVLSKDFGIEAETEEAEIYLSEEDTKIGEIISKPIDYWYEVELNPFTEPQTIIGYDEEGAKIFRLYPEGAGVIEEPITPEDIPVVDEELDLTSTRPVQNQAIYRAILMIREENAAEMERHGEYIEAKLSKVKEVEAELDRIADETEVKLARLDEFATELERFDEIEAKLLTVDEHTEKLRNLDVEDISDSFIASISENVSVSLVKVYKQGNVINGSFVVQADLSTNPTLFTVNDDYLPLVESYPSGVMMDGEFNNKESSAVIFRIGKTTKKCAVVECFDSTVAWAYLSFTYICA